MKISPHFWLVGTALTTAISATSAFAAPNVVTSIKPLHSLISTVMEGVATPYLIVDGAASPHTFTLTPSAASALADSDVVFWLGPEIEAFLADSVQNLAENATISVLMQIPELELLPVREGGTFESHDHDDDEHHDHDDHDDHKDDHDDHEHHDDHGHDDKDHDDHDDHDDHGHDDHDKHDHDDHDHEDHEDDHGHDDHKDDHDDDHHAHGHGAQDSHIWLDPQNAKIILHEIAHVLSDADPENAKIYEDNAEKAEGEMDALTSEISAKVSAVADKPFIVFHDAYQYFENRFGLKAAGTITVNPDTPPGVQRVAEIRDKIRDNEAVCVFSEPQFQPTIVKVVTEGTGAKTGELDPLGAGLENGPNLYSDLLRGLATGFVDCLKD